MRMHSSVREKGECIIIIIILFLKKVGW